MADESNMLRLHDQKASRNSGGTGLINASASGSADIAMAAGGQGSSPQVANGAGALIAHRSRVSRSEGNRINIIDIHPSNRFPPTVFRRIRQSSGRHVSQLIRSRDSALANQHSRARNSGIANQPANNSTLRTAPSQPPLRPNNEDSSSSARTRYGQNARDGGCVTQHMSVTIDRSNLNTVLSGEVQHMGSSCCSSTKLANYPQPGGVLFTSRNQYDGYGLGFFHGFSLANCDERYVRGFCNGYRHSLRQAGDISVALGGVGVEGRGFSQGQTIGNEVRGRGNVFLRYFRVGFDWAVGYNNFLEEDNNEDDSTFWLCSEKPTNRQHRGGGPGGGGGAGFSGALATCA